jgi:nucleoside-diphosphate-sugar epimerase
MKIFVTGACGFIGSHLVEALVKQNHKVKALTFYNARNSKGCLDHLDKNIFNSAELISDDIKDHEIIFHNTKKKDVILHLAALIGIPNSYKAVKSYIDINITGTYNVLNLEKINNVSKIIVTSTGEVYGTAQKIPIQENHPLNAQSPYAASKIAPSKYN